ncbi:dihydrolipoyl dehydrogenase family protein [Desulforhopalus singaporensis]|uniref:Glutathione reductase (NADPH) n=1 Tax=Desulforhopalus singaporensis TaxID=91360 RepID=A0A1H0TY70_9BACT|nr:NAD(P)/FAD-dependent oxidoreductase [Desulforhopalus singaporensis]SDP58883.1 glutathione reductase (NADPH) [Desulforhopalus singaporensis]
MKKMDVVVIGAGTAGQTVAYDLAVEGYEVVVVEKSETPGGVCSLAGCQAKKYFYELTELVAKSRHLAGKGVVAEPEVSWSQIVAAKNEFTSKIPSQTVAGLKGTGIRYLEGQAKFVNAETVQVGDEVFTPRFIVIATGARPMALSFAGAEHLVKSDGFLEMKQIPRRMTFIGGGFVSFEFAHFAARLGAEQVTILENTDRVLGPFDADMVDQLVMAGRKDGVEVRTGISITSISEQNGVYSVLLDSGEIHETDLVVHGAGRIPNIDFLNLEAAGINWNRRGIEVDELMRTTNNNVYAVGDCAATPQLARVADMEAHTAAASIVSRETGEVSLPIDYEAVPAVLFTYPQLAMVGKTEEQLQRDKIPYWKSTELDLSWPTYRRIGMKHAGYKILVDNDGRILGAHVLCDNGSGLINTLKQAVIDSVTAAELYQTNIMSPYPSRESDLIYMLEPLLD